MLPQTSVCTEFCNMFPFHSQFQQEYQTFFHKSFRVSDYIPGTSIGLKELLQFCEGITVSERNCVLIVKH